MAVPSMATGGMEMMVAELSRALARRGHDVGITCLETRGELGERLATEGIPVTVSPAPGLIPLLVAGATGGWFRKRRPEVLHVHSGVWLKAVTAARAAAIPRTVYTCHGLLDPTPLSLRLMMRKAAASTSACVAVSEPLAKFLIDEVGVPRPKVSIISNGIDTERYRPDRRGPLRADLGLNAEALVFGVVARLVPGKNIALLIESFHAVAAEFRSAYLVIAGDGPERAALEGRARALGVADRVRFLGLVADTAGFYRELDIFVLPSLAEGTSISILEAMASGAAVIATRVGGNPALLDGGAAGRLVPSNDSTALANALRDLSASPESRALLGQRARTRAVAHYSHGAMVDQYLAQYTGLSERTAAATPEIARVP